MHTIHVYQTLRYRLIFHTDFMQGSINFKFGVVYAKDNQMSDEEFYSNSTSYGLNWDHVGQVGLFFMTATHQQFF